MCVDRIWYQKYVLIIIYNLFIIFSLIFLMVLKYLYLKSACCKLQKMTIIPVEIFCLPCGLIQITEAICNKPGTTNL